MSSRFLIVTILLLPAGPVRSAEPARPGPLVGYTELQTNLPGGRHANVRTMRAMIVNADGTGRRLLAEDLVHEPDAWTQFAGWSPDGKTAVIGRGWQSPENAQWETQHGQFRFTPEGWLLDSYLQEVATGHAFNVTAVERVSFYNGGLFFWPSDSTKLGFTALIDGNSHPFRMDRDGRNKVDLTKESKEFAYGFSSSRDGQRIAYHRETIKCSWLTPMVRTRFTSKRAKRSILHDLVTGRTMGVISLRRALQLSSTCGPCRRDGPAKLAHRGGYRGVIEFLDVPDFHGGSSDVPVWSADGGVVYFTAQVGSNVELFRTTLDGQTEQLTQTPPGTLHYHPQPSLDGQWLIYGSKRAGVRQLFVMLLVNRSEQQITDLSVGRAAMWPHWQPMAKP